MVIITEQCDIKNTVCSRTANVPKANSYGRSGKYNLMIVRLLYKWHFSGTFSTLLLLTNATV